MDRSPAEFSQDSERPVASLARPRSVRRITEAPSRSRWTAVETPRMPPPMTATRLAEAVEDMGSPFLRELWL